MLKRVLENRVPTGGLEPLPDDLTIRRSFHIDRMYSKALCRNIQSQPMAHIEQIMHRLDVQMDRSIEPEAMC